MLENQPNKFENFSSRIPIVIGVTGHRDLHSDQILRLREIIREELEKISDMCCHSPLVMLNSLAEGADQLCAEVALQMGIPLIAALPLQVDDYSKDFSDSAKKTFFAQCAAATHVFVVSPIEEYDSLTRHFSYRQAGIYIANHCHVLVALWDGTPAIAGGCGTAEVVDFKLNGNYVNKNASAFNPQEDGVVIHIDVTRSAGNITKTQIPVKTIENVKGSLEKILALTDQFNKSNYPHQESRFALVDEGTLDDPGGGARRLHQLYKKADYLSVQFRDKHLKIIKWLSIMAVGLVITFLVYDEMESNLFLLFYGVILLISALVFSLANKNAWHTKYLDYRVLTESLRVQFYLCMSGINHSVCNDFTWSQKMDVVWVTRAIQALIIGYNTSYSSTSEKTIFDWINGQFKYHTDKWASIERIRERNDKISRGMFIISVLTFGLILVLEFLAPDKMLLIIPIDAIKHSLLMHDGQQIIFRGILKILLGAFSAVTLFLSNYYGKLSLNRRVSDHKKMAALYKSAMGKWGNDGIDGQYLLTELAREEIIENGVWLSYNRDNAPTIDL
jgi:hypothetical protein